MMLVVVASIAGTKAKPCEHFHEYGNQSGKKHGSGHQRNAPHHLEEPEIKAIHDSDGNELILKKGTPFQCGYCR
ncbi:hypothetical protein Y1Q_0020446 [Alligator mississippiensis]|uniref:Uncharacterized protein n=1 Tax=Alligator mississippiensis TaxID=8496 RepID=A0A151N6Q9_ALLMI|nr:hypothetical protein Y1Q_0020446 [Alligator mississippiensis]